MSDGELSLLRKSLAIGTALAILALILGLAAGENLRSIADPDFFWHLKTGDWIWEHRSLPNEFLFSATAPPVLNTAQHFTMTSYWLVQVAYHLLHATGGMAAIVALKMLLMALFLLIMWLRREGERLLYLGLILLAVVMMGIFPFERPQTVSFIFFALLLYLLDGFRRSSRGRASPARLAAIPLLMLVWANSHGAFIIGEGVILLYLVTEGAKLAFPKLDPLPRRQYRNLLAAGGAGLLAAFINPNTYHVLAVAWLPRWITELIREYQSSVAYYVNTADPLMFVYWFLVLLAGLALALSWRKPDLTSVALVIGTGCFSFFQLRYLPFFVVAALPVIGRSLSRDGIVKTARILVLVTAVAAGVFFFRAYGADLTKPSHSTEIDPFLYPTGAADFLQEAKPAGNMFNQYTWGGYLLWRLAQTRTFIDGRNSNQALFEIYTKIMQGNSEPDNGLPYWKSHFKAYGVRYTVTPFFDPESGQVYHLLDVLLADYDWVPVFVSSNAVIFVENNSENQGIVDRYALQKSGLLGRLVDTCSEMTRNAPSWAIPYLAKGDLLVRRFKFAEAIEAYEQAARLVPLNPVVKERLAYLKSVRLQ